MNCTQNEKISQVSEETLVTGIDIERIFKVNATRKNIPVAFTLNVIGVAFSLKVKEIQKEG